MSHKTSVHAYKTYSLFLLVTIASSISVHVPALANPISTKSTIEMALTVHTDRPFYFFGKLVEIFGTAQDLNGTPIEGATIGIEVKDPRNNTIFLDIVYSQSDGAYEDSFRLPSVLTLGECHVFATAHKTGYSTATAQTSFFATILGDVNGDGKVNTSDLVDFSKAYGSESGDPNWNPKCDLNDDGKIAASDLFDLSKNYGQTI